MEARLRIWWQQIKIHRIIIQFIAIFLAIAITLILIGYLFDWTGFNGYSQVTTAHTISGLSAGTVTRTEVYQPGKTLWDWMQLLFIPVVLAIAGFWFSHRERKAAELRIENDKKAAELRAKADREIEKKRDESAHNLALNTQREDRLQKYLDSMSQLLLANGLRKSEINDEVRNIARARTLTVLYQLDQERKRNVLQFLYETNLISKHVDGNIVNLERIDFSGGDYSLLTLCDANLQKILIWKSIMQLMDLRGADLTEAWS